MAGFFYGLGISLTHLALLITSTLIKPPDFERARKLDKEYFDFIQNMKPNETSVEILTIRADSNYIQELGNQHLKICEREAEEMNWLVKFMTVIHAYSLLICLYREVF